MADIRELELEQDGYVRKINRLLDEIDSLTSALTRVEMLKDDLCVSHTERMHRFDECEAWQGKKQEAFFEDYAGDYMAQCRIYLGALGRTTGEIQTERDVRERELDEVQSLMQEITREIEALTSAGY